MFVTRWHVKTFLFCACAIMHLVFLSKSDLDWIQCNCLFLVPFCTLWATGICRTYCTQKWENINNNNNNNIRQECTVEYLSFKKHYRREFAVMKSKWKIFIFFLCNMVVFIINDLSIHIIICLIHVIFALMWGHSHDITGIYKPSNKAHNRGGKRITTFISNFRQF